MFISGLTSFVIFGSLSTLANAFPASQNFFGVTKRVAPVDVAWDAFVKLNETANEIFPQLIAVADNPDATPKDALKLFNTFDDALKQTGDSVSTLSSNRKGAHAIMPEHSSDDLYLLCQIIFSNAADVYSQLLVSVAEPPQFRGGYAISGPGIGSPVAEYTTTYTKYLMNSLPTVFCNAFLSFGFESWPLCRFFLL